MSTVEVSSSVSSTPPVSWRFCRIAIIVCLIVQFILACDTSHRLTPTHDEYWHLPLGLLIWKTGQFDTDVINPPLLRLWASLPLSLGGAKLDTQGGRLAFGETGDYFWLSNPEHRMLWFTCGRIMVAIMNGVTGWLLACWARRWFGEISALAVALLWCGCPTILANGCLVTHDAAAAFGFVSGLYALVCWREEPTWRRAIIAGACLGLAQLLKITCILLFPMTFVIWLLLPTHATFPAGSKPNWKTWLGQGAILFGTAIVVLNAGYPGQQTCQSLKSMGFLSQRFQSLQQIAWLNFWPIPVPRFHIQALDRVAQDLQNQHTVYLDGEWNPRGFYRYYLETMLYKLPLGTLLLIVLAKAQQWLKRSRVASTGGFWSVERRRLIVIWVPILMLLIPASLGANQYGIRYVLPVLPLFYLYASQAAMPLSKKPWGWYHAVVIVALISVPFSLRYHPHHLAYFNEWAGGPDNGKAHLVDSNLDWGQDLHGLKRYLSDNHLEKIGLAYFGTVHPNSIGIQYEIPPVQIPRPGDYAISANFLMGRPFIIRKPMPDGKMPPPSLEPSEVLHDNFVTYGDQFAYFRFFEPRGQIGHSIYVYHLTAEDVQRFRQALRRAFGQ